MTAKKPSQAEIERRLEAYRQQMLDIIDKHGWFIQGVFGSEESPILYNYTIGMLDKFGFEMVVFALRLEVARSFFNELGALMKRGVKIEPDVVYRKGECEWWPNDFPLLLKRCVPSEELYGQFVAGARRHAGRADFPVLQMVLPDEKGLFPHEPGFNHTLMDRCQPLLYASNLH